MTLKPADLVDSDEDAEDDDLEGEEETEAAEDATDDLENADDTDDGEDDDEDADPKKKGKPKSTLTKDQKRDLQFMSDLRAKKSYAVKEAREHLDLEESGKPDKPAKKADAPLTRRELDEFEAKMDAKRRAEGLFSEFDRVKGLESSVGVVKSSDRDDVVQLAWDKGLTIRQAVKLMPRFEKRQRNAAKKKKAAETAAKPKRGRQSTGRERSQTEEQLAAAAKGKPSGSPERNAYQAYKRKNAARA